ncbi:MAG: (Fe-S)-binding protein [Nitrososphaeria archaeon]
MSESASARGRNAIIRAILEGIIEPNERVAEIAYYCAMCGNCNEICKLEFDNTEIVEAFRRDLVNMGLTLRSAEQIAKNIEVEGNPYGKAKERRFERLRTPLKHKGGDFLYFVGCVTAYNLSFVANAAIKIFETAGADFTLMETEECCCLPLLKLGFHNLAEKKIERLLNLLREKGVKKIVFSCPGCYRAFRKDYPELGFEVPFELVFITEYVEDLLEKGKLEIKDKIKEKVAYHDPCELGRHLGIYDSPRNVLKSILESEIVEMERNKSRAFCCGVPIGLTYPEVGEEIAVERVKEAISTNAEILATECPGCIIYLELARRKLGSKIKVKSVSELLSEVIGRGK